MTRWSDDEMFPNTSYADAFDEGEEAYLDGVPLVQCPYPYDPKRIGWMDGWETQESRGKPYSDLE